MSILLQYTCLIYRLLPPLLLPLSQLPLLSHSAPSPSRSRHLPLCSWPHASCRCIASPDFPNSSTDSLCAARLVSRLELCRVAACRHMSPYRIDAVFRPHDGADSLHCRRDPSLLLRVRQVPGSYTRPDSRVSLLGCSRCAIVLPCVYVLDAR